MMAGGVLLAAAGIVDGELGRLHLGGISSASLAALAYLTIFGSLLAFSCYTWLLRRANTSMVATYAYVNPVVAVYLGSVFAGEALTLRTAVAAAIIVVGVAIIVGTRSLAQARQA
jgi:drug/metabolite transporter (DMT)-like permease